MANKNILAGVLKSNSGSSASSATLTVIVVCEESTRSSKGSMTLKNPVRFATSLIPIISPISTLCGLSRDIATAVGLLLDRCISITDNSCDSLNFNTDQDLFAGVSNVIQILSSSAKSLMFKFRMSSLVGIVNSI